MFPTEIYRLLMDMIHNPFDLFKFALVNRKTMDFYNRMWPKHIDELCGYRTIIDIHPAIFILIMRKNKLSYSYYENKFTVIQERWSCYWCSNTMSRCCEYCEQIIGARYYGNYYINRVGLRILCASKRWDIIFTLNEMGVDTMGYENFLNVFRGGKLNGNENIVDLIKYHPNPSKKIELCVEYGKWDILLDICSYSNNTEMALKCIEMGARKFTCMPRFAKFNNVRVINSMLEHNASRDRLYKILCLLGRFEEAKIYEPGDNKLLKRQITIFFPHIAAKM